MLPFRVLCPCVEAFAVAAPRAAATPSARA